MKTIKVIRFLSGEDILTEIEDEDDNSYYISYPMFVMLKHDNKLNRNVMLMDYWMVQGLIDNQENIQIMKNAIMAISDTSDTLEQYYKGSVDKLRIKKIMTTVPTSNNEIYETTDSIDEEEMMQLIAERSISTIH